MTRRISTISSTYSSARLSVRLSARPSVRPFVTHFRFRAHLRYKRIWSPVLALWFTNSPLPFFTGKTVDSSTDAADFARDASRAAARSAINWTITTVAWTTTCSRAKNWTGFGRAITTTLKTESGRPINATSFATARPHRGNDRDAHWVEWLWNRRVEYRGHSLLRSLVRLCPSAPIKRCGSILFVFRFDRLSPIS